MSPVSLDGEVVRRHLEALGQLVSELRPYSGRPIAELQAEPIVWRGIERNLQLASQNAIDVAVHWCAAAGRSAEDYRAAVITLGELGVLPANFATEFAGIAGFRNVLVHLYLEVDAEVVRDVLDNRLDDFVRFAGYVVATLDA